jgi:cytochrome c-type biogenesis protein CcmH/NrfG
MWWCVAVAAFAAPPADTAFRNEDWATAAAGYAEHVAAAPDDAPAWARLARSLYQLQRWSESADAY